MLGVAFTLSRKWVCGREQRVAGPQWRQKFPSSWRLAGALLPKEQPGRLPDGWAKGGSTIKRGS